jgi:hypothetical protein
MPQIRADFFSVPRLTPHHRLGIYRARSQSGFLKTEKLTEHFEPEGADKESSLVAADGTRCSKEEKS